MKKDYIGISILAVIAIGAVWYGFAAAGSPFLLRKVALDSQRISDLSNIKYAVGSYYEKNSVLPQSLSDISARGDDSYSGGRLDPQTGLEYEYAVLSPTSYQLCAVFSASSDDARKAKGYNDGYYYGDTGAHGKGRSCFTYAVKSKAVPAASNNLSPTNLHLGQNWQTHLSPAGWSIKYPPGWTIAKVGAAGSRDDYLIYDPNPRTGVSTSTVDMSKPSSRFELAVFTGSDSRLWLAKQQIDRGYGTLEDYGSTLSRPSSTLRMNKRVDGHADVVGIWLDPSRGYYLVSRYYSWPAETNELKMMAGYAQGIMQSFTPGT